MSLSNPSTPRERCYHGIRHAFSDALVDHLTKHPEVLSNAPQLEAVNYGLLKLLDSVHAVLEQYGIEDRP